MILANFPGFPDPMAYHGVPQPRAPGRLFADIHRIAGIVHHPHAAPPRGDVRLGGGHVLRGQHLLAKALPPWGYGDESKSKTAPLKTLNMVVLFVGTTLYHNSKDEDLLSLLSFTYIQLWYQL
jgi:hypothetical protein